MLRSTGQVLAPHKPCVQQAHPVCNLVKATNVSTHPAVWSIPLEPGCMQQPYALLNSSAVTQPTATRSCSNCSCCMSKQRLLSPAADKRGVKGTQLNAQAVFAWIPCHLPTMTTNSHTPSTRAHTAHPRKRETTFGSTGWQLAPGVAPPGSWHLGLHRIQTMVK